MMLNDSSMRCIFDGTKFFWRSRTNLDVCIVEHGKVGVYEIIFYEPSCDVEAPRVYLDQKVLRSKLDDEDIDSKLSFAKRNNVPLTEKFVTSVVDKTIADYLLNRVKIDQHVPDEKVLNVSIRFSGLDALSGNLKAIFRTVPKDFVPYRTKHHKIILTEVVEETLAALNRDTGALHESCEMAAALCDINDKPLTAKERWRMPLVIGKVDRGQRLNAGDTRIFRRVQFNMKTDQDLAAMNNVMNRTTTISTSNSTTVSTATTPRSRSLTPSSSCMHLDTNSKTPRASTLLSDTACSRNKNMREEAATPRASACKSRKSKKTACTPRHKKSAKSPKTGSTGSKGSCSIRSHTTSSDGFEASFCEVDALEEKCEGDQDKEISSAVAFVVSGLQAFGSSIKASFNFGSGTSTKGECKSTDAAGVIVKGEEFTLRCTSAASSRSVRTIRVFKKDSVVAEPEKSQGSLASMAAAAADAVNALPLIEQGAFMAALPDIKEHEGECMEMGAVDSLKKPVHKAVRRNSLLGSFVQLIRGKSVTLSERRDSDDNENDEETHIKPLQSGFYVPVVSNLLRWGTGTSNKYNQVLPGE